MKPGARIKGPAIIAEDETSTIVGANFGATDQQPRLHRPGAHVMSKDALAAIRTQVMWNRLIAVVEEQAQSLLRTAFGTITREAGDLSAGVYDTDGHMIAQAMTGTPGHVNTMATAVAHFFKHFPQIDHEAGRRLRHQRSLARHRPPLRLRDDDAGLPRQEARRLLRLHLPCHRRGRRRHVGQGQFLLRGRHAHSAHEDAQGRHAQRGADRRSSSPIRAIRSKCGATCSRSSAPTTPAPAASST